MKFTAKTTSPTPTKPDWMSSEALDTLRRGYLLPTETVYGMFSRIATTVEKYIPEPGLAGDIFECLWLGFLGGSTPVLSNFGTNRGLPISCYALGIDDNLHSIYSHLKEAAALSQHGGGVGAWFGDIRPAGAPISTGGKSTGIVPWMRQYDLSASSVSQGGTRKGSYALYVNIDHPDLFEVLRCKDHSQGDPRSFIDSNIAVTVTNQFLEEMLAGDTAKKEIFSKVLELRLLCGSPYIIFIDNVNDANPDCYKARGLEVKTSNLCLVGDTLVETKEGYYTLERLYNYGNPIEVRGYNTKTGLRYDWNPAKVIYNGLANVITLTLSDGSKLQCTPEHRLATAENNWIEAQYTLNMRMSSAYGNLTVVDISEVSEDAAPVYDLMVESEDHNFYVITDDDSENGILAHNCSEITLYTDENHTFVCVLSSLNLARWEEWKDYVGPNTGKTVPELLIYLLDAVCEEFIAKASRLPSMGRAVRFAKKSRALGAGTMGLAALYQSKNLPFSSEEARALNIEIHKYIHDYAKKASRDLAATYGEPEWCEGSGMRHTHLLATAPTRTNSVISGAVSQGIEPLESNFFVAKQAKGTFIRRNPYLEAVLEAKRQNTDEVWDSLVETRGSVAHLDFLSPHEKQVFLTAREIDQLELIRQAAERQPYICQAQSLNLFIDQDAPAEYIWLLHLAAWRYGLKSLYYLRSSSRLVERSRSIEAYDNIVVTKPGCPYCDKAKEFFRVRGVSFVEMNRDKAVAAGYYRESHGTFPQIFIDRNFIGGYDELMSYYDQLSDGSAPECVACEG